MNVGRRGADGPAYAGVAGAWTRDTGRSVLRWCREGFRRDPLTAAAGLFLVLLVAIALVGPALPIMSGDTVGAGVPLSPPSWHWPLGTDTLGRSMVPRLVTGIRVTFLISVIAVTIAASIATAVGACAGYFGGWVDQVLARVADIGLTFPAILLALLIVSVNGPGTFGAVLAIVVIIVPPMFRVIRVRAAEIRGREFIRALKVGGAGPVRMVGMHVVPNVLGTAAVQTSWAIVVGMLIESGLSFLGLGVVPPTASLGSLVHDGNPYLVVAPWLVFEPAAALALAIFAVNVLGDWARDALDVKGTAIR